MADYSPNEIVDIILILGECRNNTRQASRLYAARFPNRRHPNHRTVTHLVARGRRGHLHRQRRRRQYDENDPRVVAVLAAVHLDPHISSRQIERELGVSRRTALRILNNLRYHAYHIVLVQELRPLHFEMRIEFCRWALSIIRNDPNFFNYVLFSDESQFCSTGELNRHNCHYWSEQNPHWFRAVDHQRRWTLMVWCGIINGYLIGPYFFEENVNQHSYLALLRDHLPELLENVDLETRRRMWFQQDGAAPHYARIVRQFLNTRYPGRWIGRGGPINWPSISPDLTPPDFYLWGYLKNVVYAQRPTSREDMMERIRRACAAIPRQTLLNTVGHFQRRLRLCIQENGRNFEQLICG